MSFTDIYGSAAILGDEARVAVSSFTSNAEEPTSALEVGSGSIVESCIFFQNNIAASIGPASLVLNNIVRDSNEDGMNVGANSTVIGNTVTGTYDEGLRVGAYSNVLNNNAHNNGGTGDLLVTCPSNVVGNSVGLLAPSNPSDCNLDDNLVMTSN